MRRGSASVQNSPSGECEWELTQDRLKNSVENSSEIRKHKSAAALMCWVVWFFPAVLGRLGVGKRRWIAGGTWGWRLAGGAWQKAKG